MKSVYSAVRTGSLNKAVCALSLKGYFQCYSSLHFSYSNYVTMFRRSGILS